MGAVMALDEFQRKRELAFAGGLIEHPLELAAFAANPAAAVEAWTQIGADAEPAHLFKERLLHAQLTAELDESGDAVAQQFGDGEAGIERDIFRGRLVIGPRITRVAAYP